MDSSSPLLIVITGRTASGKDTVIKKIKEKYPQIEKVLTTTSRPIRGGERDGVDYHFLTKEDFETRVKSGEFVEYVEYGGNLYGTQKKDLMKALNGDLIWRIDPSRAGQIRQFVKEAFEQDLAEHLLKRLLVIYLTTDEETIIKRFKGRGLDQNSLKKRMEQDNLFWSQYGQNYDYVVENTPGNLAKTVSEIIGIIQKKKNEQTASNI